MNNRKGLRLVQFTTHESTERTQDQTELEQLLAVLDITADTFDEWRQLLRAMRQICPGAEELTFDELSALAQRRAENYERFLVSNDHESEDAEPLDLTDTERAPTVLTIPVDQIRGVLPNVQRIVPSYLYSAAIAALFCGLIVVVHSNRPFQRVDNNVRKETITPTPPSGREIPKSIRAKIEKDPETTRLKRRSKDITRSQEAPDTTSEAPVAVVQQVVQERTATSTPTVVQAEQVSSSDPKQHPHSNERTTFKHGFKYGLGSGICETDQPPVTKLIVSRVKPDPSPTPSGTPEKSREHGPSHTGGMNGM